MSDSQRFYSEEEAQQILSAASREMTSSGMTREELVSAAREMGISEDAILRAEEKLQAQFLEKKRLEEDRALQGEFRRYMRGRIWETLSGHLGGMGVLVGIWWITGHHYFWPAWIMFFILVSAVSDISKFFNPLQRERRFQKWKAKRLKGEPVEEPEDDPDHDPGVNIRLRGRHRRHREAEQEHQRLGG